jgi:hypothetical protein
LIGLDLESLALLANCSWTATWDGFHQKWSKWQKPAKKDMLAAMGS